MDSLRLAFEIGFKGVLYAAATIAGIAAAFSVIGGVVYGLVLLVKLL